MSMSDDEEENQKKNLKQTDLTSNKNDTDDDDSFWENKPKEVLAVVEKKIESEDESSCGAKLNRKATVMVDFHEGCESDEESDVPIPKRKWGENYMNGFEQTIEEEFGEVCDESVASLSGEESLIHARDIKEASLEQPSAIAKEPFAKSLSSSDEMSSSGGSRKNKTKKKTKKNKGKESLPPLKAPAAVGGLPPLKEKRMFFRGLPLSSNNNKSPEQLGQDDIKQEPKLASKITDLSLSKINSEIENSSVETSSCNHLIKKDSKINKVTSPSPSSINQQSQQTLVAPVKSQKSSSLLGDLPPLTMASASSKSAIVLPKSNNKISANDIFGAGAYDECEDVDDEDSFGDDDIDALLGGLDQFDIQRKSKQ